MTKIRLKFATEQLNFSFDIRRKTDIKIQNFFDSFAAIESLLRRSASHNLTASSTILLFSLASCRLFFSSSSSCLRAS